MIYDQIENLNNYAHLPFMAKIANFIKHHPLQELTAGKYQIDGDALYASVDEYSTYPASERRFEIHHHHADLQLMIHGQELIEVAFPKDLGEELPKTGDGDFFFHALRPHAHSPLLLEDGLFVFIPPYHPHRPCLQVAENTSTPVRKIVFKVQL